MYIKFVSVLALFFLTLPASIAQPQICPQTPSLQHVDFRTFFDISGGGDDGMSDYDKCRSLCYESSEDPISYQACVQTFCTQFE